jgi:hypothetical protein
MDLTSWIYFMQNPKAFSMEFLVAMLPYGLPSFLHIP